jgi:hypothetical protein
MDTHSSLLLSVGFKKGLGMHQGAYLLQEYCHFKKQKYIDTFF